MKCKQAIAEVRFRVLGLEGSKYSRFGYHTDQQTNGSWEKLVWDIRREKRALTATLSRPQLRSPWAWYPRDDGNVTRQIWDIWRVQSVQRTCKVGSSGRESFLGDERRRTISLIVFVWVCAELRGASRIRVAVCCAIFLNSSLFCLVGFCLHELR